MSVHAVRAPIFEILDLTSFFGVQVSAENICVKFTYQGHRVKVKVTRAKGHTDVTKYTGPLSIERESFFHIPVRKSAAVVVLVSAAD